MEKRFRQHPDFSRPAQENRVPSNAVFKATAEEEFACHPGQK